DRMAPPWFPGAFVQRRDLHRQHIAHQPATHPPNRGGNTLLSGPSNTDVALTEERTSPPVIVVDAMGGDNAPAEIVRGAVIATREFDLRVVLVGKRTEIARILAEEEALREIPVVHAEDELAMHEGALASWRRPRSSAAVACRLIRRGDADALVSAGTTGGIVATPTARLRPHPEMLVQFAHLGCADVQSAYGVHTPRVGVLTIGSEPGKGNKLVRKAGELLTAAAEGERPMEFLGNIEGHDLLTRKVDVVVTD